MKLIKIFLITFIIILLAACDNQSTPSSVVKGETSTPTREDDQKDKREDDQKDKREDDQTAKSQVNNWREVYNLPYSISCMDERLGSSVVREFQMGKRGPTQEEINQVKTCDVLKDDQKDKREDDQKDKREDDDRDDMSVQERIEDIRSIHGGWIRTGDPKNDQFILGYIPTADEWRCGVEAVGVTILRDIKDGKHLITDEQNQKLQPCFRASPESLAHPLTQVWGGHCIPLEVFLEFLDYYRPSWEQLECHLKDLERYEMPNQVRYVMFADPYGIRNSKSTLFPAIWDRIMTDSYFADLDQNFSPSMGNMSMPPSFDEEYDSMKCPQASLDSNGKYKLDEYWLDQEIRGAMVAFIIEKKKGRRIYADLDMCSNAYIVQGDIKDYEIDLKDVQEFKEFALNISVPAYIMKAKGAEKAKAEMIQLNSILNTEIEVPFSQYSFLYNLPKSQQVELAQWYLDIVIAEVRKYFKGYIWVASNVHYDDGHPDFPGSHLNPTYGQHWKNLSFAEADHVSFTLDGSCDFKHVERFLDVQFEAIMEIVKRDNVTWSALPGFFKRSQGPEFVKGCKDEFDSREVEMHQIYISKQETLPIKPYFLNILGPPRSWTKIDEGYSPTQSDASRGDWELFSLDVMEKPAAVLELWMEYAKKHVIN